MMQNLPHNPDVDAAVISAVVKQDKPHLFIGLDEGRLSVHTSTDIRFEDLCVMLMTACLADGMRRAAMDWVHGYVAIAEAQTQAIENDKMDVDGIEAMVQRINKIVKGYETDEPS